MVQKKFYATPEILLKSRIKVRSEKCQQYFFNTNTEREHRTHDTNVHYSLNLILSRNLSHPHFSKIPKKCLSLIIFALWQHKSIYRYMKSNMVFAEYKPKSVDFFIFNKFLYFVIILNKSKLIKSFPTHRIFCI
jgi:hypothetical protein